MLPAEYVPTEDRQRVMISLTAPEGASLQYMERYLRQVEQSRDDARSKGHRAALC